MKFAFHVHAVRAHFAARYPTPDEQRWVFDWVRREEFDGLDISDSWDFSAMDATKAAKCSEAKVKCSCSVVNRWADIRHSPEASCPA